MRRFDRAHFPRLTAGWRQDQASRGDDFPRDFVELRIDVMKGPYRHLHATPRLHKSSHEGISAGAMTSYKRTSGDNSESSGRMGRKEPLFDLEQSLAKGRHRTIWGDLTSGRPAGKLGRVI